MGKEFHTTTIALQSEIPASQEGGGVPEWVHLLPTAAGLVQTGDTRGPYSVNDAAQIIASSFAASDKLPIDQDHAMDLAAKDGRPAPARGWITEMNVRADGIWGRVEWTKTGQELLEDRAYRGISPVIALKKPEGREVVAILRASLVNRPNLRGLTALNQETETMFQEEIAKLLGLPADASESDITTALNSRLSGDSTELQFQIGEIGVALGCAEGANAADIIAAAKATGTDVDTSKDDKIVALQSTVDALSATVTSLQNGSKKSAAEAFVDNAIKEVRAGVQAGRDRFIALHQQDPAGTEALINGLPKLDCTHTTILPPAPKDGEVSLNAEETDVAAQLGLSAEEYAKLEEKG